MYSSRRKTENPAAVVGTQYHAQQIQERAFTAAAWSCNSYFRAFFKHKMPDVQAVACLAFFLDVLHVNQRGFAALRCNRSGACERFVQGGLLLFLLCEGRPYFHLACGLRGDYGSMERGTR